MLVTISDAEGNYDSFRAIDLHPYESFDWGKVVHCQIPDGYAATTVSAPLPVRDQMITLKFDSGCERINCSISVMGTFEYVELAERPVTVTSLIQALNCSSGVK